MEKQREQTRERQKWKRKLKKEKKYLENEKKKKTVKLKEMRNDSHGCKKHLQPDFLYIPGSAGHVS